MCFFLMVLLQYVPVVSIAVLLQEQIDKRRTQLEDYDSWKLKCDHRYSDEKPQRLKLRNSMCLCFLYCMCENVQKISCLSLFLSFSAL